MKTPIVIGTGVTISVAAIILLGLLGGSLIVAYSGFGTSPRHGGSTTFVLVPQAYVLAATMYGMSIIGMLALLRNRTTSRIATALAVVMYAVAAALLTAVLAPQ